MQHGCGGSAPLGAAGHRAPRADQTRRPRPARPRRAAAVALTALLPLAAAAQTAVAAPAAPPPPTPRALLLLLDGSDAMAVPLPDGRTRWDAMRDAVAATTGVLPDGALVGARLAGPDPVVAPPGCADTRPLAPVAPLDRGLVPAALGAAVPVGPSSTAEALRAAADDLPANAEATVVLVAGRTGACNPAETCAAAREVVDRGVVLRVDAIGLAPDPASADELRCVTEVTGGRLTLAASTAETTAALTRTALRAISPVAVSTVDPVRREGDGPVALSPGTHGDVLRPGETRRYVVDLVEGDQLLATVSAQAPAAVADRLVLRLAAGDSDAAPPGEVGAPHDAVEVLLGQSPQALRVRTGLGSAPADVADAAAPSGPPASTVASRAVPVEVTLEQFGAGALPAVEVPVLVDVDVVDTLLVVEAPAVRPTPAPAPPPQRVVVVREEVPTWLWGLVAALAWAVVALAVVLVTAGGGPRGRRA